eukprot:5950418-Amphidinium_carterae.1
MSHGCKSEGVAGDEMGGVRGAGPPYNFSLTSPTRATRSGADATQSFGISGFSEEVKCMVCVCESAMSQPVACLVLALLDVLHDCLARVRATARNILVPKNRSDFCVSMTRRRAQQASAKAA